MKTAIKIFILLYAGILPIISVCLMMYDLSYWLIYGEYSNIVGYYTFVGRAVLYLSAAILSYLQHYCIYHFRLLVSAIGICIASMIGASYSPTYYLAVNLITIALHLLILYNLVFVGIHIIKQIHKHRQKFRILVKTITRKLYGYIKGVS